MTDVIRSVLFVDFDNVFFSLQSADKAAAKSFADDPRRWLEAIESGALIEGLPGAPAGRRRILMRRCYANPAVMRYFRSYFTRSGFQIVDCPPLTGRGKNSADIYMVVDMLDALRHETHFDEFIILSGDADFTPVLLRLRAYDRSSVIYSNAVTAAAYKSLCDGMITEERLIDLTGGEHEAEVTATQAAQPAAYAPGVPQPMVAPPERRIADRAMPRPADRLPERYPDRLPNPQRLAQESPRGIPERRRPPAAPIAPEPPEAPLVDQLGRPLKIAPEMAALARRVNASTNVPMFASEVYAALFRAIALDVRDNGFSFNRTVNAVIRRLGETGLRVRPQHVAFVVKGLMLSGHEFVASDTPATLAKGFRRQVLYLCANEDLTLSEVERGAIGMWIVGGLRNVPESEIIASEPMTTDASLAAEVAGIDPNDDPMQPLDLDNDEPAEEAEPELDFGEPDDDAGDAEDAADLAMLDGASPEDGDATEPMPATSSNSRSDDANGDDADPAKPGPDLDSLLARIRAPAR